MTGPATTNTWSIGEASALAIKATRGAGYPWGIAEEAGWAIRWLARHRLPGLTALARYLSAQGRGACPLALGSYLADSAAITDRGLLDVAQPLLLVPFLSRVAGRIGGLDVTIMPRCFHVDGERTDLAVPLAHRAQVHLTAAPTEITITAPAHRVDALPAGTRAILEALAHRTYAPATESSREKGAGAGLTDND